ncbi:MAG: hypothetical protein IKH14_07000 [Prevotella sp.]|nr:hypothetical protein [Prevotella sp.]
MGTNYYAVKNRPTTQEPIHIGKSSIGWLFCFERQHIPWNDPPVEWNTYEQVKDWLIKYTVESDYYVIINEYDEIISFDEFVEMVDEKQNDEFCKSNEDNFAYSDNVNGYRFTEGDFC